MNFTSNFKVTIQKQLHTTKKRGLQPHLKKAVIDRKNAAIGYSYVFHSRVSKHDLSCATIAPCGTQSHISKNAAQTGSIAAFFTPYSCVFTHPQMWDPQLRFVENAAIYLAWATFKMWVQAKDLYLHFIKNAAIGPTYSIYYIIFMSQLILAVYIYSGRACSKFTSNKKILSQIVAYGYNQFCS